MKPATSRSLPLLGIGQLWIATTASNVLFYLFYLVVGRKLGPHDYSLFGALIGIVYITGALASSVQISVARSIAESRASGRADAENAMATGWLVHMLLLGSVIFVIVGLASRPIGSYLHSNSVLPILWTAAIIALTMLIPVTWGTMQGRQRFPALAATFIFYAGTRLAFGVVALALGFRVSGVLVAIVLSSVFTLAVGLALTKPSRSVSFGDVQLMSRSMAKALLPTLVAALVISFPTTVDVIIVRNLFPAKDAGLYTAASLLGRMVLFLPVAVTLVLFPMMAQEWAIGNSARGLLSRGLRLTALISGAVTLVLVVAPSLAIKAFVGDKYSDAGNLVPLYATSMFAFSLAVVFLYYHLAAGQTGYVYFIVIPHVVLELILLFIFHNTLTQVIWMLLIVNTSLVLSSLVSAMSVRPRPKLVEALADQSVAPVAFSSQYQS